MPTEHWQCDVRDRQSRRRLGATPAYARTRNYDVTYAYSLYATLVLARDASPRGAGSIGGSTSNLGTSDGAITSSAPNIFVMWKAETFRSSARARP
jgi:hypothetical protein